MGIDNCLTIDSKYILDNGYILKKNSSWMSDILLMIDDKCIIDSNTSPMANELLVTDSSLVTYKSSYSLMYKTEKKLI